MMWRSHLPVKTERQARKFADFLLGDKYAVFFFDEFEKAALWGEDLTVKLQDIYANLSRFCIMFISEYYVKKPWTKSERQAAVSRMVPSVEGP